MLRVIVWVRQSRKTDEEHEENCVEERFQSARVKFYREGENDGEARIENREARI